MRLALTILVSVAWLPTMAQKSRKVSAEYTYYAPSSVSVDEAKRTALDRAMTQALADAFGTQIMQTTSTLVTNDSTASGTSMLSTGRSEVGGEWIETIGTPYYNIAYESGMLVVTVAVTGKARPLSREHVALTARVLRGGTEPRYEADSFNSGDDLYLNFQSPVDGHLLVYLIDHAADKAYCLLPYSGSADAAQSVAHDTPYTFFRAESAPPELRQTVDEYTMTCRSGVEHDDIVLIFSPQPLTKSNTSQTSAELPRELAKADFERWRAGLMAARPDVQIINKSITIKRVR